MIARKNDIPSYEQMFSNDHFMLCVADSSPFTKLSLEFVEIRRILWDGISLKQ